MLSKSIVFALLSSLMAGLATNAQRPADSKKDTVYVYKTKVVYDTIYVTDTVIEKVFVHTPNPTTLSILRLDTLHKKAALTVVSSNYTANIPLSQIVYTDNFGKAAGMKKLSFMGVVMFAFKNMVVAQTDLGVSIGSGIWWANCSKPLATAAYKPTLNVGLHARIPVDERFFIHGQIKYHYLAPNTSYKTVIDTVYFSEVGAAESGSEYHQLSLPLKLGYILGPVQAAAGLEASYRISEPWLARNSWQFGMLASIGYHLSKPFAMELEYYHGLTNDFSLERPLPLASSAAKTEVLNWKSYRFGLAFIYYLRSKPVR